MSNSLARWLGGPPAAVLMKLVFLSIVVGAFLALFGLTPPDLLHGLRDLAENLYNLGFGAVRRVGTYFIYGAVIVVPVWLVLRLLGGSK
jgi:hypothetical protein